MVYGIVFFWGAGRTYPAFSNEFLKQPKPWVLVPQNQKPLPSEIPFVDVQQDSDGLLKISPDGTTFSDWFQKYKPNFFAINVLNSKSEIHHQLDTLVPKGWEEKVLVQSEIDVILASLKGLRPRWAFGSSVADRVRWKSFDSIGLVGAVTHTRDVFFTALNDRNGEILSDSIVAEIRKRNLFLVIGPLKTAEEVQFAKQFNPDGYLILNTDLRSQIR